MPRKGAKLSPEAKARQDAAIKEWKLSHTEQLSISVPKGKRAEYKALAERRGVSLRKLVLDYLDGLLAEDENA